MWRNKPNNIVDILVSKSSKESFREKEEQENDRTNLLSS